MAEAKPFVLPEKIEVEPQTYSRYFGRFISAPYERGWGTTVGNALRRILLSSIEGAAVIAVRVNEFLHEFASIPGVVEDVFEILLNLRHLPIRLVVDTPKRLFLRSEEIGPVYARSIEHDADVEILDPDHYICTIGDKGYIELEMVVKKGRGFVPAERNQDPSLPKGFIPVASLHTPVRKVNFKVEPARIGQLTEYERLILEVWTNGTVTPIEAVEQAAKLWMDHARLFESIAEPEVKPEVEEVPAEEKVPTLEEAVTAELEKKELKELGINTRIVNILQAHKIRTVGDLIRLTPKQLKQLPNIGPKSVNEILAALQKSGLELQPERES